MRVKKIYGILICIGSVAFLVYLNMFYFSGTNDVFISIWWWICCSVSLLSLFTSIFYKSPTQQPIAEGRIAAIIPVYNEEPENIKNVILALLNQTKEIDEIHVVDDGSVVPMEIFKHPKVFCYRQENAGKRFAQATALRHMDPNKVDFILTIDSDSVLNKNAVESFMRTMSNPKVAACSGVVIAKNYNKNLLTIVQDLNWGTSTMVHRSSRTAMGAIDTTSGAIAMYKAPIIFFHLEDYLTSGNFGDDRRLCIYALLEGDTIGVMEAYTESDCPEKISQIWRQRVRWAKSGWSMLPIYVVNFPLKKYILPLFSFVQLFLFPIFIFSLIYSTIISGNLYTIVTFLIIYCLVRYPESLVYVLARPNWRWWLKLLIWLFVTPLDMIFGLFFWLPAKYWAIFKLKDKGWGTRQVEKEEEEKNNH